MEPSLTYKYFFCHLFFFISICKKPNIGGIALLNPFIVNALLSKYFFTTNVFFLSKSQVPITFDKYSQSLIGRSIYLKCVLYIYTYIYIYMCMYVCICKLVLYLK